MNIEVKPEADGKFGLYVNGTLLGTSKHQYDADHAKQVLLNATKRTWAEQREIERGWAALDREAERASWGTGEMGQ